MIAFPYAHDDAVAGAPRATLALLLIWALSFAGGRAWDSPIEAERTRLCGEAVGLVLAHPTLASAAPRWPGCTLPRHVAGPQASRFADSPAVPEAQAAALSADLATKAARAAALADGLSDRRFGAGVGAPLLHGGPAAFLLALLALWLVGPSVERRVGRAPLVALFVGGGAAGALARSALPGAGVEAAVAALAGPLGALLVVAPESQVRVAWCYWWFRSGSVRLPAGLVAGVACLGVAPWSDPAGLPAVLLLILPPLLLGGLAGGLSLVAQGDRALRAPARPHPTPDAVRPPDPATAAEVPDTPDVDVVEERLVTPRCAVVVPPESEAASGSSSVATRPLPRLMLRRARLLGLRDDRAILGVGASVVEQRWDEVLWMSSAIAGDVGPLLDLILGWTDTPRGPVASGLRVLAAETDYDALFRLPAGAPADERFAVLAGTVRDLAPGAGRLPDDEGFVRPRGYPDARRVDEALAGQLLRVRDSL